jgi:predicted RNase H-like HicB family nuclease
MLQTFIQKRVPHLIDGYQIKVLYDDENQYIAYFENLPDISAFADTYEQAIEELKVAWEGAKEAYKICEMEIPSLY